MWGHRFGAVTETSKPSTEFRTFSEIAIFRNYVDNARMKRSRRASWIVSGVVGLAVVVVMAFLFWPRPITLSSQRSGDADLLARIGAPEGHRSLVVTIVDLDAAQPVRRAGIGADENTLFEAGSLTKALTGLALADSVRRREVRLDAAVGKYLDLGETAAADVTVGELATHLSGYPRLGGRTSWIGLATNLTAGNPYGADRDQVLAEARSADTGGRGAYEYSNLGAAIAGQAAAEAAGLGYPEYIQKRLFGPLRMSSTRIAESPVVARGLTDRGRPSDPWVMNGYAPAGGAVTTGADLTKLARAVLERRAPGVEALDPLADAGDADRRIGLFWQHSRVGDAHVSIVWHNGRTGGYASFMGFDLSQRRAVIVLSDVSRNVDDLAVRLLTDPR